MKDFFRDIFALNDEIKKRDDTEVIDRVYHFFVNGKASEKKRIYDLALKAADRDQKEVIEKFELSKSKLTVSL